MSRQEPKQVDLPLSVSKDNVQSIAFDCPNECAYGRGSIDYGDNYCKWCGQKLGWENVNEYIGVDTPTTSTVKGTDAVAVVKGELEFEEGTPARYTPSYSDNGYPGDPAVQYIALDCPTSGCNFSVWLHAYNFDYSGNAKTIVCDTPMFITDGVTLKKYFDKDVPQAFNWIEEFYCPKCGQALNMANADSVAHIDVDEDYL